MATKLVRDNRITDMKRLAIQMLGFGVRPSVIRRKLGISIPQWKAYWRDPLFQALVGRIVTGNFGELALPSIETLKQLMSNRDGSEVVRAKIAMFVVEKVLPLYMQDSALTKSAQDSAFALKAMFSEKLGEETTKQVLLALGIDVEAISGPEYKQVEREIIAGQRADDEVFALIDQMDLKRSDFAVVDDEGDPADLIEDEVIDVGEKLQ